MSNVKQYYDIKFPFTCNNLDGFFIDLNKTIVDKKESEILHVLLTPKKTRIRRPDFGTDLIKYIYEPNDDMSWELIHSELIDSVNRYVSNVEVVRVEPKMLDNDFYVSIIYSVSNGKSIENKEMVVKL
jgi:phage baseplate assembly protein W